MFASGTGLAPFLSVIRDPDTYEKFEEVILVHGVREVAELAYRDYLTQTLPEHELLGEMVSKQLKYYPTVTREAYKNTGRITTLIENGKLFSDLNHPNQIFLHYFHYHLKMVLNIFHQYYHHAKETMHKIFLN
jgi:ferredoxin--NADP+ reductase